MEQLSRAGFETHDHTVVREAQALIAKAAYDRALALLLPLYSLSTGYPTYFLLLGECYTGLGQFSYATQAYERALQLTPNSPRARMLFEVLQDTTRSVPSDATSSEDQRIEVDQEAVASHSAGQEKLGKLFQLEKNRKARRLQQRTRTFEPPRTGSSPASPVAEHLSQEPASFDLDHLAEVLTKERPLVKPAESAPAATQEPEMQPVASPIYSETLAAILVQQGKLDEAKKVLMHLARTIPEKRQEFRTRIAELDTAIQEMKTKLR